MGGISGGIHRICPQSDWDAGLVWKHFPSTPIKEFFKDWEEKYTSLEWIPVQDRDGRESGEIFSQKRMGTASKVPAVSSLAFTGMYRRNLLTVLKELRKIFMDCGWGSADFRKEECRKALSVWDKARSERILAEHRGPTPPNGLDEYSD